MTQLIQLRLQLIFHTITIPRIAMVDVVTPQGAVSV